MPIRSQIVTAHFKDEDGADILDAKYTIRAHLSQRAKNQYYDLVAKVQMSDDGKGAPVLRDDATTDAMVAHLLWHGLVSLEGVEDDDGNPWPVATFVEFDGFYVGQVVRDLQRRMDAEQAKVPNSAAPSSGSSTSEAPAPTSTTTPSMPLASSSESA